MYVTAVKSNIQDHTSILSIYIQTSIRVWASSMQGDAFSDKSGSSLGTRLDMSMLISAFIGKWYSKTYGGFSGS